MNTSTLNIEESLNERRFRALIENGTEAITLMDVNFLPIYRSPASYRLTGYTMEERLRDGIVEQTHPDDMAGVRVIMHQVLTSPGKPIKISFRTLHRDGHYIWLEGLLTNLLHDPSICAIVANMTDVTESKLAENLLKQSHEELRLLASHLQDVREQERTSMAREIHDELGQQLTGLKMDVSWLNKRADLNDIASREKLKGILSLLDATVGTVRRLAAELRPSILDDLGLPEAIEWHSKQFEQRFGIRIFLDIRGRKELGTEVTTGLFRIYQEALTNVIRHSGATRVAVELDMTDPIKVDMVVSDNGKGFDVQHVGSKNTLGILGMKERTLMMGGTSEYCSVPGRGTTIRVSVPYKS